MSAVVLSGLILAAMGMGLDPPTERPSIDQPEAKAHVVVKPRPEPASVGVSREGALTGVATWYAYVPGGAAAGPGLRKWLGKGWRGQTVTVCARTKCVEVRLTDWCLCSRGNRVVDLDVRSFRQLAPTSAGVVKVSVSR